MGLLIAESHIGPLICVSCNQAYRKVLSSTIQVSASVCSDPRLRCVSSTYVSWLCPARGGSGPGIRIAASEASDRILRTALRSRNDARRYTLTRFDSRAKKATTEKGGEQHTSEMEQHTLLKLHGFARTGLTLARAGLTLSDEPSCSQRSETW